MQRATAIKTKGKKSRSPMLVSTVHEECSLEGCLLPSGGGPAGTRALQSPLLLSADSEVDAVGSGPMGL